MATQELFFPDTYSVKTYTSMIHTQGVEVCRKKIGQSWIDETISKFSFGIAIYTNKAQIGQSINKKNNKYLKGFVVCRGDINSPKIMWIDLICARESGSQLLQQAEEHARTINDVRMLMLYSLPDEELKQWYMRRGYDVSIVKIWDGNPKAFLMVKLL